MRVSILLLAIACGASPVDTNTTPEPEAIAEEIQVAERLAPRYSGLSLGLDGACVLDGDTPACWGEFFEGFGAAGVRRLEELEGAKRIVVAAGMSVCAIMQDDELRCFGGYNEAQRVAENEEAAQTLEMQTENEGLSDEEIEAIYAQIDEIDQRLGPTTVATDVRDVIVHDEGGCYLDDVVHCWDENEREEGETPPEFTIGADSEIVQLAAASTHRCLLQADGRVRCWGYGEGLGWISDRDAEADQPGLTRARDAVEIAVGEDFTCYRRRDGRVLCWGVLEEYVDAHEPFDEEEDYLPFTIPGIDDAVAIAAGDMHACALRAEGRVTCWGDNAKGALGQGSVDAFRTPRDIEELSPAREIDAGPSSTCALVGDELRCVGNNRYGVFGIEAPKDEPTLFPVRGSRVLTPGYRTCVESNGELQCTNGRNISLALSPVDDAGGMVDEAEGYISYECLRRGSTALCGRRAVRRELTNVLQISVGTKSACVLERNRRVQCWQQRPTSQQRADLLTRHVNPTRIPGVERAESLDVGDVHACVVRTNGRVVCWGDNTLGLVREPAGDLNAPVELPGIRDAVQVSVNRGSTCVRKRDQTVTCRTTRGWQDVELTGVVDIQERGYGRLLLTSDHRVYRLHATTTTPIELPDDIVEISTGTAHACARSRDGRVWCWGAGDHGELGVLPSWIELTPVVVPLDG